MPFYAYNIENFINYSRQYIFSHRERDQGFSRIPIAWHIHETFLLNKHSFSKYGQYRSPKTSTVLVQIKENCICFVFAWMRMMTSSEQA